MLVHRKDTGTRADAAPKLNHWVESHKNLDENDEVKGVTISLIETTLTERLKSGIFH